MSHLYNCMCLIAMVVISLIQICKSDGSSDIKVIILCLGALMGWASSIEFQHYLSDKKKSIPKQTQLIQCSTCDNSNHKDYDIRCMLCGVNYPRWKPKDE